MCKNKTACAIILVIIASILLAYPNFDSYLLRELGYHSIKLNDIDAQKFMLLQFGLVAFVGFFIAVNKWLKAYFLWCVFCLFTHNNSISYIRLINILLFLCTFEILSKRLNKDSSRKIINTICVITLIHVVWMILQKSGINVFYMLIPGYTGCPVGVYGTSNNAGSLIAITMPLFFRRKWIYGLIPCVYGLFLSGSLTSILSVSITVILMSCMYMSKIRVFFIVLIILCITAVYSINYEKKNLEGKNLRFVYWERITKEIFKKPIKGYGLGTFRHIFPAIDKQIYKNEGEYTFKRAHNDYLELAFNQGIVGLLLFLGFIYSIFSKLSVSKSNVIVFYSMICICFISLGNYLLGSTLIFIPLIYLSILNSKENYDEKDNRCCNVVHDGKCC